MEYLEELGLGNDGIWDPNAGGFGGVSFPSYSFDMAPYGGVDAGAGYTEPAYIEQPAVQFEFNPQFENPPVQYEVQSDFVAGGSVLPTTHIEKSSGGEVVDYTTVGQTNDLGSLFSGAINLLGQVIGTPLPQTGPIDINGIMQRTAPIVVNARNCPPGYHQPKRWGMGDRCPPKSPCTRNRHMNPLNPRALMRATRRLSGFQHFATKTEKLIRQSFQKAGVRPQRRLTSGGKCGTCRKTNCSC